MVEVRMEKVQVLSIPVGRKKEKKNSYTLEAGRGKRKKGKKKKNPPNGSKEK